MDFLLRDPASQLVSLPDGRLLARHARGITVLHGIREEDLRRVLDLADGTRTAAKICETLAGEYDPEAVQRFLANLTGDLLQIVPAPADRKSTRLNSSHRCISYAVF